MLKRNYPRNVKIIGEIIVSDKDKGGHVMEVVIETEDFERFVVINNKIGKSLYHHLNKKIKAKGIVIGENTFEDQMLKISSYEIINNQRKTFDTNHENKRKLVWI